MSTFLMFKLKALNYAKLTSSLMYLVAHIPKGFPSPCNLGSINLSTRCKVPSTNLKDVKWYHTVIVASEEGWLRVNSVQYYTCTYLCSIPLCLSTDSLSSFPYLACSLSFSLCRWVLLKNVHLAPQWLVTLEKKLHSLNPHSSFRLFMTMEINPKVRVHGW